MLFGTLLVCRDGTIASADGIGVEFHNLCLPSGKLANASQVAV